MWNPAKNLEKNKAIALFMGAKYHKPDPYREWVYDFGNNRPTQWSSQLWEAEQLEYHICWDWIMPVVERIQKDGKYVVTIMGTRCTVSNVNYTISYSSEGDDLLLSVWECVGDFCMKHSKETVNG